MFNQKIVYFIAVVEEDSFSSTARKLYLIECI